MLQYCLKCHALTETRPCSVCGGKRLRDPLPDDPCLLTEKEGIWAEALCDALTAEGILCSRLPVLGAVLTAYLGPGLVNQRVYVLYSEFERAREIACVLFGESEFPQR